MNSKAEGSLPTVDHLALCPWHLSKTVPSKLLYNLQSRYGELWRLPIRIIPVWSDRENDISHAKGGHLGHVRCDSRRSATPAHLCAPPGISI
jgi:hypothetical protein